MHVVAVTRWARPPDEELGLLAELLLIPTDALRARRLGVLPAVLAHVEEPAAAEPLLAVLRDRGHAAVCCEAAQLASRVAWLVAATRWARPPTEEAALLATVFGMAASELLARARKPLPAVLARWLDADSAAALGAVLRDRGHGAVWCETSQVGQASALFAVRQFELAPGQLLVRRGVERRALPWERIQALLRCPATRPEFETGSPSAASAAGRPSSDEPGGERLLLVVEPWSESLVLDERALQYGGLGRLLLGTVHANFIALVDQLRQRAPGAWYDQSLLGWPRGVRMEPPHPLLATAAAARVTATDLAVHLLLLARRQGQLDEIQAAAGA